LPREGDAESYEIISFEKSGGATTISLNRPKVLNAFNGPMHAGAYEALNHTAYSSFHRS
jgi:2-(1,2-epoxy-1,2-dihydrophenyl)acetyl-CoA isomerase